MNLKNKIVNSGLFKIAFISIIFGMLATTVPLKSQPDSVYDCPDGFVKIPNQLVTVIIGGDTCQYRVGLCVKCPAGPYPIPFTVRLAQFEPYPDSCGIDFVQAMDSIIAIITDPDWIDANISQDCFAGWGPCEYGKYTSVYPHSPICWRKCKYLDESYVVHMCYVACSDEECVCEREDLVCSNGSDFERIIGVWYRKNGCSPGPCASTLEGEETDPPDPTPQNPEPTFSNCFGFPGGPCNP